MTRALVTLLALALAACQVDRKSPSYQCTTTADCADGRTCEDGYCIGDNSGSNAQPDADLGCPAACTSCDPFGKSCLIACSTPGACDDVHCPAGFSCTITCTAPNACGDIFCGEGTGCTIGCTSQNACGDVHCGASACQLSCSGDHACGDMFCTTSCKCDVACGAGNMPCGTQLCPSANGHHCTDDATDTGTCSSAPDACDHC